MRQSADVTSAEDHVVRLRLSRSELVSALSSSTSLRASAIAIPTQAVVGLVRPCKLLRLGEAGPERPAISLRSHHRQDGLADTGGLVVDDLLAHVRRGLVEGEAAAPARVLRSIARGQNLEKAGRW